MSPSVSIPRDRVDVTLGVMRRFAREGSRQADILHHVRQAVRALGMPGGSSPDPAEVMRSVYSGLRGTWTYAEDPYGEDHVQPPEVALRELSGDCDDAATLVASLARALGLRSGYLVSSDADGSAQHVSAVIETEGRWVPADLAYALPWGEDGAPDAGGGQVVFPVDPPEARGLGFLPEAVAAVTGVASVVSGLFGGNATADAIKDQAKMQFLGTLANQRTAFLQSKSAERIASQNARLVQEQTRIQAETDRARIAQADSAWHDMIQFLRDSSPVLALLVAVNALTPVLTATLVPTPRRARRRAAA